MARQDRNTIFVEDARVLCHTSHPNAQFVLRLAAPECAARATAGSFVHIRCSPELPMRRPLSIMQADPDGGWIEVLYKIVGAGLADLSRLEPGDTLSIMGPIGNGFSPDPERPLSLLIGGGVGIPPLIFLAKQLKADNSANWNPLALFGSEIPFPFELSEPVDALDDIPPEATSALTILDQAGVASRLASNAGFAGCFPGFVTDLADSWLTARSEAELARTMVFACGPEPMLEATQRVAARHGLPSQLCLEEFMACAVGGCAGCAVRVLTPEGPTMKRVCVDGPVFAGETIYPTP